MIVVFTDKAEADLESIGDHIASDSPRRAKSFVKELRERCESVADMPRAFPLIPRYEQLGVRRRIYRNYLIFYRVDEGTITIVHVLHGAMDYMGILFPS
jgi:toxin ParE1/3/4